MERPIRVPTARAGAGQHQAAAGYQRIIGTTTNKEFNPTLLEPCLLHASTIPSFLQISKGNPGQNELLRTKSSAKVHQQLAQLRTLRHISNIEAVVQQGLGGGFS